jgi:hypothetical protein
MSLWSRLLDAFDAPRFCKGCGRAIVVERDGFDPKTGEPAAHWYWACPSLSVDLYTNGSIRQVEWRGGGSHDYGTGRPRWHRTVPVTEGEPR